MLDDRQKAKAGSLREGQKEGARDEWGTPGELLAGEAKGKESSSHSRFPTHRAKDFAMSGCRGLLGDPFNGAEAYFAPDGF